MEYIIILAVIIAVINSFANAAKKKTEAERREAQRREAQRQWQQAETADGGNYAEPAWRAEDSNYAEPEWDPVQPAAAQAGDYDMPSRAGEQADFDEAGMVYAQDVSKHSGHQHQGYAYVNEAGMYEGAPLPGRKEGARKAPGAPQMRPASAAAQPLRLRFEPNSIVAGIVYAELLGRVTPGVPPYMRNR